MSLFIITKANPWLRKLLIPLGFYGAIALCLFWREEISSINPFFFVLEITVHFALIPLSIALFAASLLKTIIEKDNFNLIPAIVHATAAIILLKLFL